MRGLALLTAGAVLAGCAPAAPPTARQVEAACVREARGAAAPTGQVAVGLSNNRGLQSGISIGVTDDFLRGRDPAAVYAECYQRNLGVLPQTPYTPAVR